MLYDILPPLFLLASFGGITAIIARVVTRFQRDRLSEEIQAHVDSDEPVIAEEVLKGKGSRISMVTNRLAFVPRMGRGAVGAFRGALSRGARAGAGIGQGIASLPQRVRLRRSQPTPEVVPEAVEETPTVATVRRVEMPAEEKLVPAASIRQMLRRPKSTTDHPLKRAAVCLKESQFDKAEDILLPYIVRHARDAKAYMLLGRAAIGRGSWDEAIEIFQQVRSIDEHSPRLFSSLGNAAFKAGQFTLAVEALQKARDTEPANVAVREQLLTIAQRMDNQVLERSVRAELRELREHETAAQAK